MAEVVLGARSAESMGMVAKAGRVVAMPVPRGETASEAGAPPCAVPVRLGTALWRSDRSAGLRDEPALIPEDSRDWGRDGGASSGTKELLWVLLSAVS